MFQKIVVHWKKLLVFKNFEKFNLQEINYKVQE